MGVEKWYEVTCDICGDTVHTKSKNKKEIESYGFILKGKNVYCCKECADIKLENDEIAFRDFYGKLIISKKNINYK